MIPFSLLSGKLNTSDGKSLEVRILELSADSFSIRLPFDYLDKEEVVSSFVLFFFEREKEAYVEVLISDFTMEITGKNDYYSIYRVVTANSQFAENAKRLSFDYLRYIDCKITLEDNELSARYTNYPVGGDSDFCETYEEQIKELTEYVKKAELSGFFNLSDEMDYYIALENEVYINDYLCKQKESFIEDYFSKAGFSFHPISKVNIKGLIIGNSYCYNLTPSVEEVERVIEKAFKEDLTVTIVIPPVPQFKLNYYINYYNTLKKYNAFWQVNDIGMLSYIGEGAEAGVLLNKTSRDPRYKYLNKEVSNLMFSDSGVYIPYYQTNTGTFCPIHAIVNNGSRGNQERVLNCNRECNVYHFLYPRHLELVGKYNSLFGFNKDVLCDFTILERLKNQGITRVVINL